MAADRIEVIDAADAVAADTDPGSQALPELAEPGELQQTINNYLASIESMQAEHGVYHDRIGEELISLGLAYRSLGKYNEAIDAFNRSLHINRINQGLHNENMLSILELIIETNTRFSDWEALDKNYSYLYWVNQRILGEFNTELLPVIDRLGRWHLNAYELGSDPIPFKHLLIAEDLFNDAVKIIETNYGEYDLRQINALYGIAMTNYKIAIHATTSLDFSEVRTSTRSVGRLEAMLEEQDARQELISDGYRGGKESIQRIIEIYEHNPELPTDAHAIALIHLGDWYMLFNRRITAAETYAQANAKLLAGGMQQKDIDLLFNKPRSLPALSLPIEYDESRQTGAEANYVIARFDVSKSGRAVNIEILEAHPAENVYLMRRAKNTIRSARFRPRIENGQPVASAGVNVKYVFQD